MEISTLAPVRQPLFQLFFLSTQFQPHIHTIKYSASKPKTFPYFLTIYFPKNHYSKLHFTQIMVSNKGLVKPQGSSAHKISCMKIETIIVIIFFLPRQNKDTQFSKQLILNNSVKHSVPSLNDKRTRNMNYKLFYRSSPSKPYTRRYLGWATNYIIFLSIVDNWLMETGNRPHPVPMNTSFFVVFQ